MVLTRSGHALSGIISALSPSPENPHGGMHHSFARSMSNESSGVATRRVECFFLLGCQRCTLLLHTQSSNIRYPSPLVSLPRRRAMAAQFSFLHDFAGPSLPELSEMCLLPTADVTSKFQIRTVLSGECCHTHGKESPVDLVRCNLTRLAVGHVMAC